VGFALVFKGLPLLRCAFQFVECGSHAEGAALTFSGFELLDPNFYEEKNMQRPYTGKWLLLPVVLIALLVSPSVFAQETSAGLQGTVKDPTGALVIKAKVEVASPALIGTKKAETDQGGYYRFANLPPGVYSLTVTLAGFRTFKQDGIDLSVGHLPNIEVRLEVGAITETVEVSSQAALIDSTQSKVQANISSASIQNLPTQSTSFQSVIQFAPGARSEPLQNNNTGANSANNGFQINGASNSENSYLVDGQETASIFDGHSQANMPMEFIDEVQVKTSGFEAEYGGALGGVVNVISKRGSNDWHGSVFMDYYGDRFNAALSPTQRRNPAFPANNFAPRLDQPQEYYYPVKDHRRIIDPGFTLGGALIKDRLWAFIGTAPDFDQLRRTIVSSYPGAVGPRTFNSNTYTYYSQARLDFRATEKIRLYGSWNYQYARTTGLSLPNADDVHGLLNTTAGNNPDNYNNGIGQVNPQVLYNVGADVTITPSLIATTRFGYFYYDTQSRGLPTGNRYLYADTNYPYATGNAPALAGTVALNGTPLAAQYLGSAGFSNIGNNQQTAFDRWKKYSFSQDLAYFKNFIGTHNLKFGYGFNHGLAEEQLQTYNTSLTYVGYNVQYVPNTTNGAARCAAIVAQNMSNYGANGAGGNADGSACQGLWGTVNLTDYIGAGGGKVGNWNHTFYVQDAWTVAKGLTLNLGVRLDKENLPSYNSLPGFQGISFGWGQKIAPRMGAAYDVLHNGKLKVYGSWGYFYDIMKFQLPQGSFGGNYWHDCVYALDSPNYNLILPQRDSQGHYCPVGTGATPANGSFPAMRFIENYDYREPSNDPNQVGSLGKSGLVDPNLLPMKQHVMTFGAAWEIKHDLVFEPVFTRARLDRTIEDAGTITQNGEVYYIVNPGFGVNSTVPNCNGCPPNEKAIRNYDGLELRLTKRFSHDWFGAFSYTYSRLYGNYGGLTATDVSDGIGRNGANTDRAFDEPFMAFDAHGKVADGPLATDRPHTLKANVYYNLKWWKFNTVFGLFQQVYSGTPLSSYLSVWGAPVFVEGRGKWVDMTRDSATGNWIAGAVSEKRTPRFVQSDLSAYQEFKVSKTNERLVARVGAECVNCLNQHHVTIITQNLLRTGSIKPALCTSPGSNCTQIGADAAGFDYGAVMTKGYDYVGLSNSANTTLSSLYGTPQAWQRPRTVRFQFRFTF
jgi:outer membrane receptor protein involved in Fe transport